MNNDKNREDIQWFPRVPKWKLKKLYESVAQGMWDEELIDDVGIMLYLRCRDILIIYNALVKKEVTCPRCLNGGRKSTIPRKTGAREEHLKCKECGWQLTWHKYHRAFKKRQLNPGGAASSFSGYIKEFDNAKTPQNKMLAIDLVIHSFHYSLKNKPDLPTRAAGVNLISGDLTSVVRFLDELSGLNLPSEMKTVHSVWKKEHNKTYWPGILENEGEKQS